MNAADENRILSARSFSGVLVKLFFAWLYALSISQMILNLNELPSDVFAQSLLCLAVVMFLAALTWQRYNLLTFASLVLILTVIAIWQEDQWLDLAIRVAAQLRRFGDFSVGWFFNRGSGSTEQVRLLALAVCLLISVFAYIAAARFNLPFILLAVWLLVSLLGVQLPRNETTIWLFLGGIAVIAAWSRQQSGTYHAQGRRRFYLQSRFMLQSLPVAAIGLAAALWLGSILPPVLFHSSRIDTLIDDVADWVVIQQDQRLVPGFSLESAGFYPLHDRLGGPVSVSNEQVLKVRGYPKGMLLRGQVRLTYDGHSWTSGLAGDSWRFDSAFWQSRQSEVFDLDMPDFTRFAALEDRFAEFAADPQHFTEDISYNLSPVKRVTRNVFLAGRPLRVGVLEADDRPVFFDIYGKLFLEKALRVGQVVQLNTRLILTDQPDFPDLAAAVGRTATQEELDRYEEIKNDYLQLPELPEYQVDGSLHLLALLQTRGIEDPYERCLALRDYLIKTCNYNLSVAVPPADVDFVSWFLETREGYCVYFATALTMLCRLDGIPARYVEGYYAPPSSEPGGLRIITGNQAHAWTEIYLAGMGWITVDATPGGATAQPTITAAPTETATPSPTSPPLPSTTGMPTVTPTTPNETDHPANWLDWLGNLTPWYLLLLLIFPVLFVWRAIWLYRLKHQPARLSRRFRDTRGLVRYYWREIQNVLACLGSQQKNTDTPRMYFRRLLNPGSQSAALLADHEKHSADVLDDIERALFSGKMPGADAWSHVASYYDLVEQILKQNRNNLTYFYRRILKPGLLPAPGDDRDQPDPMPSGM